MLATTDYAELRTKMLRETELALEAGLAGRPMFAGPSEVAAGPARAATVLRLLAACIAGSTVLAFTLRMAL